MAEGPDSGQTLAEYEPENLEEIPEYELKRRGLSVICINYSFLWQHLEPSRLLPMLVDKLLMTEITKKEAESYQHKFAQNAVILNQLFTCHCSPLKLCDTLEVTGQGYIARKLLKDFRECSTKHPTLLSAPLLSADTTVPSNLLETSELFQQLQKSVMELLDQFPTALTKFKQVLASVVLPLGEGKVAPLVDPLSYEGAQTVRELFRLMACYWNPLSTDLLSILLEASGYNQAASKVADFVEARASKGHLVLCIRQLPTLASGENDLDVADLKTIHNAPLSELQSLHPAVFARLPEHKITSTRTTARISVEVNKPLLCIADYEEITTALSGFFEVPKAALLYAGCSKAPLVLCWLVTNELVAYIRSAKRDDGGLSGHKLLLESKVTGVAVGDQIFKLLTIKEVELFGACYYDLVERVHYLLSTGVNVNVTSFNTFFPLYNASHQGHDRIVKILLQAGATVNQQIKSGDTALHIAVHKEHQGIVDLLLKANADPNLQLKFGWTSLYIAVHQEHQGIVELLLEANADPDLQLKESQETVLIMATVKGSVGIVRKLIQHGANLNHANKLGVTALHIAVDRKHEDIVDLLLEANADLDLQLSSSQETALMIAARKGDVAIVKKLIQHGTSVNLTNKDGLTAFDIASVKGHTDVCQELMRHFS